MLLISYLSDLEEDDKSGTRGSMHPAGSEKQGFEFEGAAAGVAENACGWSVAPCDVDLH